MQFKRCMWWRVTLSVFVVSVGLLTIFRVSWAARAGHDATPQQDIIRLENRINQMEQRLISMEMLVQRLQQRVRPAATNSGDIDTALDPSRLAIQALESRLIEDECALAKLDERTLPPSVRAGRNKPSIASQACRMHLDEPLRLRFER